MTQSATVRDAADLKVRLRRSTRGQRLRALALVTPLLVFIVIFFIVPILDMMVRSAYDPQTAQTLPRTVDALSDWDLREVPGEDTFEALGRDLLSQHEAGTLGRFAVHLNHEMPGARSTLMNTASGLARRLEGEGAIDSWREAITELDANWERREFWSALSILSSPVTLRYYLAALDRTYDADGRIVLRPEFERVYIMLFQRTFLASFAIVGLCLLLGFPIAYHIANSPVRIGNLLLILVLLPFWTALLVRTAAWIVLLQQQGVINQLLVTIGLVADEDRLRMVYNMTGTIVAMTHIMLPFMVLPLYSVMKGISREHTRAALSLGATPLQAFLRVYLPQTMPGIGAGCILVFILSIGFYITPALVGGRTGRFISSFVAYHIQQSLNWGLAAALAGIILLSVLVLYYFYNRFFGAANIRLG